MEIGDDGEDVAFQEQTVTDNGPGQESTVGCVTDGKNERFRTRQNNSMYAMYIFFHLKITKCSWSYINTNKKILCPLQSDELCKFHHQNSSVTVLTMFCCVILLFERLF